MGMTGAYYMYSLVFTPNSLSSYLQKVRLSILVTRKKLIFFANHFVSVGSVINNTTTINNYKLFCAVTTSRRLTGLSGTYLITFFVQGGCPRIFT